MATNRDNVDPGSDGSDGSDSSDSEDFGSFLSSKNLQIIAKTIQNKLCIKHLTKDFFKNIVIRCKLISEKYPTRSIGALNQMAVTEICDLYIPQRNLKQFKNKTDNYFVYRPKPVYTQESNNFSSSSNSSSSSSSSSSSNTQSIQKVQHTQANPEKESATDVQNTDTDANSQDKKSKLLATIQEDRESNKIIRTEYVITVDSTHRDPSAYPSASRYMIKFERSSSTVSNSTGFVDNIDSIIRNVRRIEMIKGVIPNIFKPNVNIPNNYLLLSLDEIVGRHFNSSPIGKNIFGRMQFDLRLPINTNFIHVEPVECYRTYTPEPLSKPIVSLTVNVLNFNGNPYSFGTDSFIIRYWQAFGAITIITTWQPSGLSSNDIVIFRQTTNARLDEGHDGFPITVITPTVFTVPVDSTTVSAGIAPNIGGPPVNVLNPLSSSGYPYPTIPPNDPNNPADKFGYILDLKKQNAFTFKIISEVKMITSQAEYAKALNY